MSNSGLFDNSSNKENIDNNSIKNDDENKELDDIIICLQYAINDINKDQNKFYIIQELENILIKLKKYSKRKKDVQKTENIKESKRMLFKPPSSGITTIELTKNLRPKYNYSPLRPKRNNSQDFSNNSCSSNKSIISKKEENFYSNYSIKSISKRSEKSPRPRYNGIRVNGKKEGKGTYFYPNGCKYEGYFKNDKKNGKGIFYYSNGDKYEGNFEDGYYEGKGIFYFNNGDRYEGNFEKNKYSGKGKYYYHNGDSFDGYWMDDKKCGEGIYYFKNGDKIVGKFYNGKPYGTHIKQCVDGRNFQISY